MTDLRAALALLPGPGRARRAGRGTLLLLALWPVTLEAAIINVGAGGTGAGCEASSIAAALLPALLTGDDEIRLSTDISYTNISVQLTNWDPTPGQVGALLISGGWSNCADTTASGRTPIDGKADAPVFDIAATPGHLSLVTLRDLEISGATRVLDEAYAVRVSGGANAVIENLYVHDNSGGIKAESGGIAQMDFPTTIIGNVGASDGAGVHCDGGGVFTSSLISTNTAEVEGGGLFATGGCDVTLEDGAFLIHNTAFSRGGGISARNAAHVSSQGGALGVEISVNHAPGGSGAAGIGGGVWAQDTGSTVTLVNTRVDFNDAGLGGGIAAWDDAVITMRGSSGPCPSPDRCSTLSGNSANNGAAAQAENGGEVRLFRTHLEENWNPGSQAASSLLRAFATGLLDLEGVSIWNNTVRMLVHVDNSADADLAFVSTARNGWTPFATGIFTDSLGVVAESHGEARLRSSIFWDIDGFDENTPGGLVTVADCLIVNDDSELPAGRAQSMVDPLFVDPDDGDLHLQPGSPAIDYCDDLVYSARYADDDGDSRGFDLATNVNGSPGVAGGLHDIGWDEAIPIFADGFESGDTSAWSSRVP